MPAKDRGAPPSGADGLKLQGKLIVSKGDRDRHRLGVSEGKVVTPEVPQVAESLRGALKRKETGGYGDKIDSETWNLIVETTRGLG